MEASEQNPEVTEWDDKDAQSRKLMQAAKSRELARQGS
jgi:hypothetical protein